jgi:hypothetical protein
MATTTLELSGSSTVGAYQKLFEQESIVETVQWAFIEKIYHGNGSSCPFAKQAVARVSLFQGLYDEEVPIVTGSSAPGSTGPRC